MRLSLRNKRVSFLVRLLILSPLAELSFVQSSSRECNQTDYYFQLLPRNRDLWTRDDLEDLLRSTHTDYAPFYSSEPGNGDVLRALMTLDSGSDNERIELFYSDVEAPQYPLDRSVWVPEHICPVFMSTVRPMDFDFAFSDLHNIRPVDPDIHESNRGTAYFGTCPTCNELVQQGSDTCICGDFFQPPETSRGIVARSWLYMQLRYPDLPISKCHLEQLLAWHESNPPTYDEKQRNKMICSKYQGNRNPYVDFPELALNIRMFETECEEAIDHGENNITGGNQSNQTNSGNSTVLPVFNPDDDTDGNADDSSEADNTEPGNTEADNTDLGNTEAYNTDLGNTEADNTELGNTEANNTEVENTEVDTEESVSGNIFDTDSRVEDTIEPVEDPCSTLLPGDIYFYSVQASPSRIGMIPLMDLPQGLALYISDTLSFASSASSVQIADDYPDLPLLRLTMVEAMEKGRPFGYGNNLLLGDAWEVVTQPITLRGDAFGGDEIFLFCYDQLDQLNLIAALTTNGAFRDADLQERGFGKVILPSPMDYYVYSGPLYSTNSDYQKALMDPSNWLGFDVIASEEAVGRSAVIGEDMEPDESSNVEPTRMHGLCLILMSIGVFAIL